MGVKYNPGIVTNGLAGCWDAGNLRSNRGRRSLINWDSWKTTGVGTLVAPGPAGFGGLNQTVAGENSLVSGTDPWGNTNILWQSNPSGDSNGDGGWAAAYNSTIDNTKLYRSSVWVRRISTTTAGTYYHGLATNGTGVVYNLSNGVSQTNPYWHYVGLGGLLQNTWYLTVGHIYPWNYSGTSRHPDSGGYYAANTTNIGGGAFGGNIVDCKFPSNATTMYQRVYHFYSTDTTSQIQFFHPRLDLVDGTEPSIYELVNNVGSKWSDISGYGNDGTMYNGVSYTSGSMGFNGVDNYIDMPNQSYITYNGNYTFSAWVKPNGNGVVFQNSNGNANDRNGMQINNTGTQVVFGYYAGTSWVTVYAPIVNNQWNHIVATNSGSTLTLYVNGVPYTTAGGSLYVHTLNGLYIGRQTIDNTNRLNGSIANIATYNRVLTAQEVKQNFNALRGRFGI